MVPDSVVVFDTETTGVSVASDRIVQAFLGVMLPDGSWAHQSEYVIDPGVPVLVEASSVHGFTNEKLKAEGRPSRVAIPELVAEFEWLAAEHGFVVAHNLPFDFTVLKFEAKRHGLGLSLGGVVPVDTLTLDRALYPFVKGSGARKLEPTARRYGVEVDASRLHDASYDCYLAGMVAYQILGRWEASVDDLLPYQVAEKAKQGKSLQDYLRRNVDPDAVVDVGFPFSEGSK